MPDSGATLSAHAHLVMHTEPCTPSHAHLGMHINVHLQITSFLFSALTMDATSGSVGYAFLLPALERSSLLGPHHRLRPPARTDAPAPDASCDPDQEAVRAWHVYFGPFAIESKGAAASAEPPVTIEEWRRSRSCARAIWEWAGRNGSALGQHNAAVAVLAEENPSPSGVGFVQVEDARRTLDTLAKSTPPLSYAANFNLAAFAWSADAKTQQRAIDVWCNLAHCGFQPACAVVAHLHAALAASVLAEVAPPPLDLNLIPPTRRSRFAPCVFLPEWSRAMRTSGIATWSQVSDFARSKVASTSDSDAGLELAATAGCPVCGAAARIDGARRACGTCISGAQDSDEDDEHADAMREALHCPPNWSESHRVAWLKLAASAGCHLSEWRVHLLADAHGLRTPVSSVTRAPAALAEQGLHRQEAETASEACRLGDPRACVNAAFVASDSAVDHQFLAAVARATSVPRTVRLLAATRSAQLHALGMGLDAFNRLQPADRVSPPRVWRVAARRGCALAMWCLALTTPSRIDGGLRARLGAAKSARLEHDIECELLLRAAVHGHPHADRRLAQLLSRLGVRARRTQPLVSRTPDSARVAGGLEPETDGVESELGAADTCSCPVCRNGHGSRDAIREVLASSGEARVLAVSFAHLATDKTLDRLTRRRAARWISELDGAERQTTVSHRARLDAWPRQYSLVAANPNETGPLDTPDARLCAYADFLAVDSKTGDRTCGTNRMRQVYSAARAARGGPSACLAALAASELLDGDHLVDGIGIVSYACAIEWLKRAAEHDDGEACFRLAKHADQLEPGESTRWLARAVSLGHLGACWRALNPAPEGLRAGDVRNLVATDGVAAEAAGHLRRALKVASRDTLDLVAYLLPDCDQLQSLSANIDSNAGFTLVLDALARRARVHMSPLRCVSISGITSRPRLTSSTSAAPSCDPSPWSTWKLTLNAVALPVPPANLRVLSLSRVDIPDAFTTYLRSSSSSLVDLTLRSCLCIDTGHPRLEVGADLWGAIGEHATLVNIFIRDQPGDRCALFAGLRTRCNTKPIVSLALDFARARELRGLAELVADAGSCLRALDLEPYALGPAVRRQLFAALEAVQSCRSVQSLRIRGDVSIPNHAASMLAFPHLSRLEMLIDGGLAGGMLNGLCRAELLTVLDLHANLRGVTELVDTADALTHMLDRRPRLREVRLNPTMDNVPAAGPSLRAPFDGLLRAVLQHPSLTRFDWPLAWHYTSGPTSAAGEVRAATTARQRRLQSGAIAWRRVALEVACARAWSDPLGSRIGCAAASRIGCAARTPPESNPVATWPSDLTTALAARLDDGSDHGAQDSTARVSRVTRVYHISSTAWWSRMLTTASGADVDTASSGAPTAPRVSHDHEAGRERARV